MSGELPPPDDDVILRHQPIYAYDTDDSEFIRGAEVGELEAKLRATQDAFEIIMRRTNEEMVRRITHAHGREYRIDVVDETWMNVSLEPPSMPNVMDAMNHPIE
jgi:hypothetical protein